MGEKPWLSFFCEITGNGGGRTKAMADLRSKSLRMPVFSPGVEGGLSSLRRAAPCLITITPPVEHILYAICLVSPNC